MTNDVALEEKKDTEIQKQTAEPEALPKLVYGTHITENDKSVEIVTEVAGYNKDNLEITVEAQELRISSKKEDKEEQHKALRREFNDENYYRVFRLSDKIDVEQISAEVKNGVLKIVLPKIEHAQKRQIEVKSL